MPASLGNEQVLPGSALPWLWVAQYLAVRVSEHTTGARAGSSPRHFERLTTPSDVRSHRQLLSEVCSRGRLAGVVTSNGLTWPHPGLVLGPGPLSVADGGEGEDAGGEDDRDAEGAEDEELDGGNVDAAGPAAVGP